MSALVKHAGARLPTSEIVLGRAVVTLALSWVALRRTGLNPWATSVPGLHLLRSTVGFAALWLFYYAITRLPLADATVIHYTNPVFTILLAAVFLGESISRMGVALVIGSLAGVLIMARPSFLVGGPAALGLPPLGVLAAVCGAVLSAGAYVTVRRLTRTEHPLVIVFFFALVSTAIAVPIAVPHWVPPTPVEWFVLIGVGVSTQLGQLCLTIGLQREPAGRAMSAGYLQIVFASLWGLLWFGELPDRWSVMGAAVIVGCIVVLSRIRSELRPRTTMS